MDSKQTLRTVWSHRWWLLLFALAAAAAAYALSDSMAPRYRGDALALIIPRQQASGQSLNTDQLLQVTNFYAELARTRTVQDAARREGGFREPIDGKTGVEAQPDLMVLEFSGESENPREAAKLANAYAQAFGDEVADLAREERRRAIAEPQRRVREIQRELALLDATSGEALALTTELESLQTRLSEEALSPSDRVRIIQPALTPRSPASPKPVRDAILAAIAALVLGISIALLRRALADRYVSAEDAALDLRLPVLAEVPKARPADAKALEAFRKLRAQVQFALASENGNGHGEDDGHDARKVLLLASAEARAGKTYTAANLARALAAEGHYVVAVDADLRRPTLHAALDVPSEPGLGDVLAHDFRDMDDLPLVSIAGNETARRLGGALVALPAGHADGDTAERLSSAVMGRLANRLRSAYDYVIVDSPPVLAIVDSVVLTRYADAVVLVIDARRSSRRHIRRAVQTLRAVDAPLVGLVFNRARISEAAYGYYGRVARKPAREAELPR